MFLIQVIVIVGNFAALTNNYAIMKKILFLLATILLCGCSESFEDFAKKRAVDYVNERSNSFAKKKGLVVEYIKTDSLNVVYINDSICAVDFSIRAKTYGEKEVIDKMQYIIFKDFFQSSIEKRDVYYECADNTDYYSLYKAMKGVAVGLGLKGHTFYESIMEIKNEFTEVPAK